MNDFQLITILNQTQLTNCHFFPSLPLYRKAIQGEIKISTENGETRTLRSAPDWGEIAINGDHLWVSTSASGDLCYVGEIECSKQGPRLCCPACKITAHTGCIGILIDKIKFHCKPTFKDVGVRQYREQTVIHHHWVHRRHQKGRCRQCGKSFQSKLSFGNKEIVAISCSWCKTAYHNKENCFTMERITETCNLGIHRDLIIPHSWIVKLPRKGSFKSSIRRSPKNKRSSSKRRTKKEDASSMVTVSPSELSHNLPVHSLSSSPPPPPPGSTSSSSGIATVSLSSSSSASTAITHLSSSQQQLIQPPLTSSLSSSNQGSSSSSSSILANHLGLVSQSQQPLSTSSDHMALSLVTGHLPCGVSTPPPPPGSVSTEPRPSLCAPGQHRSFAIKPIPSPDSKPLLVFINPKSGGNQGSKLMQKFQWLLNPRQVFDLTQGGPRPGLELYRKVPNLRILACGGDGTAGWILSVLDDIGFKPSPPIAVLPLGTGNDLARALGWGGGYTDEPVSKILLNIKDGEVVQLDRWDVKVTRNTELNLIEQASDTPEGGKESLPLNVINNYFSIGVDAHIALEFHEAREAHPERFNSRLRNKMFYGQAGGKDLLQRKWKDLATYITVECDGVDLTQRLRDLKVHSLLLLNIPCYGGGTRPWGSASPSFELPRTDDGLIEVIGLTTYQLPLLQAGGHGSCVAQCKEAKIVTRRTIPMQVDGEPCRLLPSVIRIKVKNQANMIAKSKSHSQIISMPTLDREIMVDVRKLNLTDYETFHYDKDRLRDASIPLGKLNINPDLELNHVRVLIIQMVQAQRKGSTASQKLNETPDSEVKRYRMERAFELSSDWCFVDSCTAERFFRIDRAQEHLHYVVDICNDDLFILDPADDNYRDDTSTPSVPTYVANTSPASGLSGGDDTPSLPVDPTLFGDNNTIVLFKPPKTGADSNDVNTSQSSDVIPTKLSSPSHDVLSSSTTTVSTTTTDTTTISSALKTETIMSDKGKIANQDKNVSTTVMTSDNNNNTKVNTDDNNNKSNNNPLNGNPYVSSKFNPRNDRLISSKVNFNRNSCSSNETQPQSRNETDDGDGAKGGSVSSSSSDCVCSGSAIGGRVSAGNSGATRPDSIAIDFNSAKILDASRRGDLSSIKRLHERGYSLWAVDTKGFTALHYAAMFGNHDIIHYLVASEPNLMDSRTVGESQTPLQTAVCFNQQTAVCILAAAGSSVTELDGNGHNAKDLALLRGDHDLATYLDPMHENFNKLIRRGLRRWF